MLEGNQNEQKLLTCELKWVEGTEWKGYKKTGKDGKEIQVRFNRKKEEEIWKSRKCQNYKNGRSPHLKQYKKMNRIGRNKTESAAKTSTTRWKENGK